MSAFHPFLPFCPGESLKEAVQEAYWPDCLSETQMTLSVDHLGVKRAVFIAFNDVFSGQKARKDIMLIKLNLFSL